MQPPDARESALAFALAGKRIVVTRPGTHGDSFVRRLNELGAVAVHIPVITIAPPLDIQALDEALVDLHSYDWVAFASANAVNAVADALRARGMANAQLPQFAAVGASTAAAVEAAGWKVAFIPDHNSGAALAESLPSGAGARILLPRAAEGLPALATGLRARGMIVTEVVAYRTIAHPDTAALFAEFALAPVDAVTFTSPSTVVQFMLAAGHAGWNPATVQQRRGLQVVCIGNTTAAAARQLQLLPTAVAAQPSQEGLIDALASCFMSKSIAS